VRTQELLTIPIAQRQENEMRTYTVWVGGSEMNSHLLTRSKAIALANEWFNRGYDDVRVEEVK
jgi:hypothetical protein